MKGIPRAQHVAEVSRLLRRSPIVALLGARQVGKTTLALHIARNWKGTATTFDLEDSRDLARLEDPMLALANLRGLVVLDEIQRRPDLFPALRVLADRHPLPARFLVLGSASPDMLRQSAESLAGRIAFHHLPPLDLSETGVTHLQKLWRRGGFPRSFTARTEADSAQWRRSFVSTFLERDLPQLGVRIPAVALRRFWEMLAHYHGQTLNSSELARSFGVSDTAVRGYIETLEATFVVRTLRPFHANISKRQVKAPKVYVTDSGILHTLLGATTQHDLERHPKVGASWEGFLLDCAVRALKARPDQCYYWATHAGAELDLLVVNGSRRRGMEFKRTTAPSVTPSMRRALEDLNLSRLDVVHAGSESYQMHSKIYAVAAHAMLAELTGRRG